MKPAATKDRTFRTFLLVAQLEAKSIGGRLALARKEAGLTQEQVAQMSTVSRRSLQDYEGGVTIPYRHFRELALIYDREVEWFLHGDRPEVPAGPDGLLGEVAASVQTLTEGQLEILERLSRIEATLATHGVGDTSTRRA